MQLNAGPRTDTYAQAETMKFEDAFKMHFKALHAYAFTIVKEEVMAEEIVQNVFCKLWEKNSELVIQHSIKAYLYRSVHNESLNYLKHLKVRAAHEAYTLKQQQHSNDHPDPVSLRELQTRIDKALKELPEQCRTIFQMSRYEELKYSEIAHHLGLSIKTVENQMGKALRLLRQKLADLLPALLFTLLNLCS